MTVVIGVDPHKRTHTAVVIDHDEIPLATLQVRAGRTQLEELLAWSASFDDRVWAIESAAHKYRAPNTGGHSPSSSESPRHCFPPV